jgi:preprotein translocase subunit SecE
VARNRKRAKERRARRPQPVASRRREDLTGAPNPLEHAAPDAELAEQAELPPGLTEAELEADAFEGENFEEEADLQPAEAVEPGFDGEGAAAVAEPRVRSGNRLITFLQGSWRELQRVQWPDRRQVMQATGVVIGFVIIAGVVLGVSDFFAKHLVNYILNGHW